MADLSGLCIDCRKTTYSPKYKNVNVQAGAYDPAREEVQTSSISIQTQDDGEQQQRDKINDQSASEDRASEDIDSPRSAIKDKGNSKENEVERRLHPKSDADFDLLHAELKQWRDAEQDKLFTSSGGDRQQMMEMEQETLAKEGYLLRKIDKLKANVHKDRRIRRIDGMLADMAKPSHWQLTSGDEIAVHTPASTNAGTLRKLYNGLAGDANNDADKRRRCLVETKDVVSKFQTTVAKDLFDLIDRELDLLNRQLDDKVINSLNNRVRNLFLQFIEDSRHNPATVPIEAIAQPMVKITGAGQGHGA